MMPVHLAPDGVGECEAADTFAKQVQLLESGTVYIRIKGVRYLLVGGLGLIKADMPQGHSTAGRRWYLKCGAWGVHAIWVSGIDPEGGNGRKEGTEKSSHHTAFNNRNKRSWSSHSVPLVQEE